MHKAQVISFEFFPPKTPAGSQTLLNTVKHLNSTKPEFFSVTFGAGGSTRSGTVEAVRKIRQLTRSDVAPHISCVGSSKKDLLELIELYKRENVKRVVVLRGDLPDDADTTQAFSYASELVTFLREHFDANLHIEVAAYPEFHPEASSFIADIENLKRKYEAGANSAITQYFYNPDAYFYLLDDCAKQNIFMPIVPGIMPILNYQSLVRFSDNCSAEVPRWIRNRLQYYADDQESLYKFGVEVVYKLCQRLLAGGAPGLHFYTLNKHEAVTAVINELKVTGALAINQDTVKL